jgi:hypothetical protein
MGKKIVIVILIIIIFIALYIGTDIFENITTDPLPLFPQCVSIGEPGTFENPNPDFVQRFFDKNGVCQILNVNDPTHSDCVDEWRNGTTGYDFGPIPPQDEFGRLSDPDKFSSVVFQCETPSGHVTHNFISE